MALSVVQISLQFDPQNQTFGNENHSNIFMVVEYLLKDVVSNQYIYYFKSFLVDFIWCTFMKMIKNYHVNVSVMFL